MGEGTANSPVHVFQPLDSMVMIGQEASLISHNGSLIDEEGRRLSGRYLLAISQRRLDESLELSLFADDLSDKWIVVLEKRVRSRRSTRFGDQLCS